MTRWQDHADRPPTIRVVIVDDHRLLRRSLAAALDAEPDIEVVAVCADGTAAVEAVDRTRPDVVLMDLCMPSPDGAASTEALLVHHPGLRIWLHTATPGDPRVEQALRAGARGTVAKSGRVDTVLAAIRG